MDQQNNASLRELHQSRRRLSSELKSLPVDSLSFAVKTQELAVVNVQIGFTIAFLPLLKLL